MKRKDYSFFALPAIYVLESNWKLTVLLLISIFLSISLQMLPAFVIREIIDENFANGIVEGVWRLAIWYLLISAGGNIVEFIKVILTTMLGQKIMNRVSMSMLRRLSELSISYFVNTPVGDIMSRLTTDVDAVNTMFSAGIISAVTDSLQVVGLLVSLYIIAPGLVLIEIAVIPVIFLITNYYRKNIFREETRVRLCVADIYKFIQEWLKGIKTVKSYHMEKNGERKFRTPLNNLREANRDATFYDSWFPCVMQTLRAVVIAVSLWLGAVNGTPVSLALSAGTLAAVCDLILKLFAPIEALATEIQTIQQAMAGVARVTEFMNQPVEAHDQTSQTIDAGQGIEINGVTFSYGGKNILHSVNISMNPGEKTVIVGQSGVGKTTLMNIVAGLYPPAKGIVRICGIDPYTIPPRERRRVLGVVPQTPRVFDGTVKENITLKDDSITMEEIETAARIVGLHDIVMRLPQGYDTILGEGASGLSSGEVQLLSLARAIASDPKVLLLDEPTSGMDSKTEQQVFAAIRDAGKGRTIFSISHRLSGVVDADLVYLMEHGEVVESGSPEELARNNGWYAMYRKIEDARWETA